MSSSTGGPHGGGRAELIEVEVSTPRDVLSAPLATKTWPGVPALLGVVGAPVLHRDGTMQRRVPQQTLAVGNRWVASHDRLDSHARSTYCRPGVRHAALQLR